MRWSAHSALTLLSTRHLRSLVQECTRRSSIEAGKKLHAAIITSGFAASADSFLYNALLHLHAACGSAIHARKVFDEIPNSHKDTVDWTVLMGSFARHGMHQTGLRLFVEMRREGVRVDDVAMVCLFSGCARLGNVEVGLQGHGLVVKVGLSSSVKSCNAAMDMYVKCGQLSMAKRVFDEMGERSVVSWTVILDGVV
ncbi:pentatricopeptide repeat-containing protein At5g15340, mitochondrial-like [Rosa rugosa]|uniref:pentatricopeptide repeat-containing protein At5g15340, mitochondrial-like n=1 Tax=Rosa rugosa TaxID=74645 RepID=UPI002B409208|nr:pentatricopeptide repeat-containing protein At5g15340, mitochondrial-like [Rosa rugosa]